ncbi:MAG TPA: TlyA family rRNA (cytidine-2'-O)-methyltransferase [Anaerolineae bacterium]|nr:TlyA family rRNA (cytidine-2'-O)-methyltransferase [Anaerolineae bacterium]
MTKIRLDVLLVERGLADSRAKAQALIMAGQVRVADQVALKPATSVDSKAALTVDSGPRFVSRGGEKLDGALEAFGIDVRESVCADVGASTGGFTDCLLQRGAAKVYAIEVGKGILHWNLRNDKRVVVMEKTNARYVESLPEQIGFVSVDTSFISLKIILPVVKKWIGGKTEIVALIKPQFEAGKKDVSRGDGVIRDPGIHKQVLLDVLEFAHREGFKIRGLIKSPLLGPKGNAEFLVWLNQSSAGEESEEISMMVERVLR